MLISMTYGNEIKMKWLEEWAEEYVHSNEPQLPRNDVPPRVLCRFKMLYKDVALKSIDRGGRRRRRRDGGSRAFPCIPLK